MPWKETQKMDQRIEFATRSLHCENFRQLCREYGISAKTGYKWRSRFLNGGYEGMAELSRRPQSHARELSEDLVCEIIRLKQAHPHWGPRKIRALYERQHSGPPPSESSFKRVLEKAGLTRPRRRRAVTSGGRIASQRQAQEPNEVWTVDFKGWWRDPSGTKVEPLTIRDEYSRMLLDLRAVANAKTETVQACFERLFEQHGLPAAIRSDNGPPFASVQGLLGLSRLSVWWLALGIDLERGRPGCPQDNGAHERMHRDIAKELQAGRVGRDQEAFDLWRQEYNHERPHEALAMATPAEIYRDSQRRYEGTPEELDYGGQDTRKVQRGGTIRYEGEHIMLSTTLQGWQVGLNPRDEVLEVWFAKLLLGHLEPQRAQFQAIGPVYPPSDSATLHRPADKPMTETVKEEPKV